MNLGIPIYYSVIIYLYLLPTSRRQNMHTAVRFSCSLQRVPCALLRVFFLPAPHHLHYLLPFELLRLLVCPPAPLKLIFGLMVPGQNDLQDNGATAHSHGLFQSPLVVTGKRGLQVHIW